MIAKMTNELALREELRRINNMQIECNACIHTYAVDEKTKLRAKNILTKLRQKAAEIENGLQEIHIGERIARLDEIEKELGM